MTGRLDYADRIVAALLAAGVPATRDVREASANRPCVLVPPPLVDYLAASTTWRLIALARDVLGSATSWEELDDLLERVNAVLPVERAEPVGYALPGLTGDTTPLPAYAITMTGGT